MSGKRKYSDYQVEDDGVNIGYEGIETEVVAENDEGGLVVQIGGTGVGETKYIRKPLTKKQLESYTQETKEDEELVMKRSRVELHHRPKRKATENRKQKKGAKRKTVRQMPQLCMVWRVSRPGCPFKHDPEEKDASLKVHCQWYLHGQCKRGDKCKFTHDENEKELRRIEKELAIMMKKEAQEKLDQEPKDEYEPVEVIDLESWTFCCSRSPNGRRQRLCRLLPWRMQQPAAPKKVLPLESKAKPVKVTYQVRTVPKIGRQHDEKDVRDLFSLVEKRTDMCDGELRYWCGNLHGTQQPVLELGIWRTQEHMLSRRLRRVT